MEDLFNKVTFCWYCSCVYDDGDDNKDDDEDDDEVEEVEDDDCTEMIVLLW